MKKKPVVQHHHLIYENERQKEVVKPVRKGLHQCLTLLRRFNELYLEEVQTLYIEAMLRCNNKSIKEIIPDE